MATSYDPGLQEIAAYAAELLGAPVALVTRLEETRQVFLGKSGTDLDETSLEASFCVHTVQRGGLLEVPNATEDPCFRDNPLVTGEPQVRFYAGVPLVSPDGAKGALCVLDTQPRQLSEDQRRTLAFLARQVEGRLELLDRMRRDAIERQREMKAAAEALRESKLLRLVTDRMPVRVAYVDRDFRFRFMNDAYARVTGLDRDLANGKTVEETLGPNVFATVRPNLERALAGETHSKEFEAPYDGNPRRIAVTYVPDHAPDGTVRGVVVQSLDVTEQRAAEAARRASDERYHALFDSMDEGFCIVEMLFDEKGIPVDYGFREFNPAFSRHTGITAESALAGRTAREIYPGLEEFWFQTYGKVALTGEPARFEHHAAPMGKWFEVHAFRVGAVEERQVGILFNDVTVRLAQEHALAEARERLETTLATARVATFDWDAVEDRVEANPLLARFFGVSNADARGGPIAAYFDAIHPDDRAATQAAIAAALAKGERFEMEYRVTGTDGEERWVLGRGDATLAPDGSPLRLSGVVLDISKRVKAEAAVRDALVLLESIAEGTHELIVSLDCEYRFTSVNAAYRDDFARVFGIVPSVGDHLLDLLAHVPDDRENARAMFDRALAGENVEFTAEFGIEPERSAFDMRFYPVRDPQGTIVGAAEIARDVTERVRATRERERLLAELAEAQGRLSAVLAAAEVGVWDYDPATGHIGAGPNLAAMFGLAPEVARNSPAETFIALIHPEDQAAVAEAFTRAVTEGAPYDVDYRIVANDEVRHVVARGFAERDESGRVVRMPGAVLDVTNLKAAEDRERAVEETFRTVFEQAPDDAIIVMDGDRVVTAWNPAAERITGWTAEEAVGRLGDLIFTPEDRAKDQPERETGEAARDGKAPDERWHLRKDGSRFWGSGTMNALHDASGAVRGYLKVFRDATAQYQEVRSLAFLRALTEAVIGVRDPEDIVRVAERMLGEHLGVTRVLFAEALPDGERVEVREEWAPFGPSIVGTHRMADFGPQVLADFLGNRTHVSRDAEREYAPGAGLEAIRAIRAASGISVPVHKEGHLAALFVVHHVEPRDWTDDEIGLVRQVADRTFAEVERARAERALRQANEELEEAVAKRTAELKKAVEEAEGFNYSISHDLRTPLRAMVSTSSILMEDLGSALDDEHRELLERQAHNANRMGRLIDELLRLSRLARAPVERETVDVTEKVRSVFEEIEEHGRTNGCRLEVQPGMTAQADRNLLRTVFHNLLGNACKFSPHGGTIRVAERDRVFSVSDEGVGFDMAHASRMFLPFERLVLESEFEGTGIGLANVKRIVERHGGRVWAESEPGQGATFYFTLG